MRLRSWSVLLAALAASALLAACGGGGGASNNPPPPPPVRVAVTPATASVNAGLTAQFTATVANTSNTAVTWAVTGGAANGTITASGLYTAPATPPSGTVTITATSQMDSSASGSATVTVTPAITVTVTPAKASVNAGLTQQFAAAVGNTSNTAVTWAVTGGAANGTITASGLYTAPATPPAGAVTVTATSAADAAAIGSAQVTVTPAITVTVTPATASVNVGMSQQLTAVVNGTSNQNVTWTVVGGGTVSASGLYTAPATVPSGAVIVTATAQADSAKSGTAAVTVLPAITVTVSPAAPSVNAGLTQQFTATVANNSNTAVNWAVYGGAANGAISAAGLYTAPATPPSGTVTITATARADSTKSGTAAVTVLPAVTVSVSPANPLVYAGQSQQFTAAVGNTTDANVTWSVINGGTITAAGLYTAPSAPPSAGTVTVTATSQFDPSKSGSTPVNVQPAITVTVTAASSSVNAGLTDQFSATVGPSGISQSVTWQVNGVTDGDSANGTIDSGGLYTAPSSVPSNTTVNITATSSTGSVVSAPYSLLLEPAITVGVAPSGTAPSVLVAGTSQTLTATVGNTSNQNVNWYVNGIAGGSSTVGTITGSGNTGVYTAPRLLPAGGGVTITAAAQADPNAISSPYSITDGWANVSLKGTYVFAIQGTSGPGCSFTEIGQFTADGTDSSGPNSNAGNVTGEADLNVSAAGGCTAEFQPATTGNLTGTYIILPNGTGAVGFTSSPEGSNLVFALTLDANGNARLIEEDSNAAVTGGVWVQSSTAALAGAYIYGVPAEIGRITAGAGIWTGTEDYFAASTPHLDAGVSGTYGGPDASGRTTMSLTATGGTTENYVLYTVSAGRFELMRSDIGTLALGRADTQDNTTFNLAAFNGGYVFQYQGIEMPAANPPVAMSAAGGFTADGAGSISGAVLDERFGGTNEPNQSFSSSPTSYTAGSNGEYGVTMGNHTFEVWMYSATGGEVLEMDNVAVAQGTIEQQQNGAFGTNALFGEYALQLNGSANGTEPAIVQGELSALNGELAGQGESIIGGTVNNGPSNGALFLVGTYTVNAAGEATGTLSVCSGTAVPSTTSCPSGDTQVFTTTLDFWIGTASQSSSGINASGTAFVSSGGATGYWQGTLTQQY